MHTLILCKSQLVLRRTYRVTGVHIKSVILNGYFFLNLKVKSVSSQIQGLPYFRRVHNILLQRSVQKMMKLHKIRFECLSLCSSKVRNSAFIFFSSLPLYSLHSVFWKEKFFDVKKKFPMLVLLQHFGIESEHVFIKKSCWDENTYMSSQKYLIFFSCIYHLFLHVYLWHVNTCVWKYTFTLWQAKLNQSCSQSHFSFNCVCVCVCACLRVCMCVCVFVCVHACVSVSV